MKRVVVTSSCAAVLETTKEPRTFSEENWGQLSVDETQRDGRSAPPMVKYRASKVLAERGECCMRLYCYLSEDVFTQFSLTTAAWDLYNAHKADIKWELVVLNPPFVRCLCLQ